MNQNQQGALDRNKYFDLLRGIAILGVVQVHISQFCLEKLGYSSSSFSNFLNFGKYGVELFFFLSGWLLSSVYETQASLLNRKYFIRRLARIYPLWIIFLAYQIVKWRFFSNSSENLLRTSSGEISPILSLHTIQIIFVTLIFLQFMVPLLWNSVIPGGWSIQAEIAHYLIFPWIKNRSVKSLYVVAIFFNVLTILIVRFPNLCQSNQVLYKVVNSWIRLGLYSTFSFFLLGILTFTVQKMPIDGPTFESVVNGLQLKSFSFIFFAISFFMVPCPFGKQTEALMTLVILLLLSFILFKLRKIGSIFQLFGRFSYFIYFMHFVFISFLDNLLSGQARFDWHQLPFLASFIICYLITCTACLLLGAVSMRIVEKPILDFARKITK